MFSKCVSSLTVHSEGLEEKESEKATCHEKNQVASEITKDQLGDNNKAKRHELVASVREELEERRCG